MRSRVIQIRGFGLRRMLRMRALRTREFIAERRRDRVVRGLAKKERPLLEEARRANEAAYRDSGAPLVTVTIATWNRGEILASRTLPSVLGQTYEKFEVVVVGDCCTDRTGELIADLADPRITFINLPVRGDYPLDSFARHCVAGSIPMIHARDRARGLWIAHLDDDEVWHPMHLQLLLDRARETDAELVWGRARYEIGPGEWRTEGEEDFDRFDLPHSSVMFRTYLRLFREDMNCWQVGLGADRHRFRRMYHAGVRPAFVDNVITQAPLRPGTTRSWAEAEDREVFDETSDRNR